MIDSSKKLKNYFATEFNKLRKLGSTVKPSKYFGEYGSTDSEDINYIDQINIKRTAILSIFSDLIDDNLKRNFSVTPSPQITQYRTKLEIVCAYNPFHEPHFRFGQRKKNMFNWVVDMDENVLFNNDFFKKSRSLFEFICSLGYQPYDLVSHKGTLRYITPRYFNNHCIVAVTLANLLEDNQYDLIFEKAKELGFDGVTFLLNDTVTDSSTGKVIKILGNEFLNVELLGNTFLLNHDTFFQNNIVGFGLLLKYVSSHLENTNNEALLDLFCGTGVIGISLGNNFKRVIGYDNVQKNIEIAKLNLVTNNIKNCNYFTADIYKDNINLPKDAFWILDPPRTGIGEQMVDLILEKKPKEIIYISCNPVSQMNEISKFSGFYQIVAMQGFDLFPHTIHMENVAILRLRD